MRTCKNALPLHDRMRGHACTHTHTPPCIYACRYVEAWEAERTQQREKEAQQRLEAAKKRQEEGEVGCHVGQHGSWVILRQRIAWVSKIYPRHRFCKSSCLLLPPLPQPTSILQKLLSAFATLLPEPTSSLFNLACSVILLLVATSNAQRMVMLHCASDLVLAKRFIVLQGVSDLMPAEVILCLFSTMYLTLCQPSA